MRDLMYFLHLILGFSLIVLPILILVYLREKPSWLKLLAALTAAISWIMIYPAGDLYTKYYPATKTLIKAGPWPWAHSIFMETKEHWGILLPAVVTIAAWLVYTGKEDESRKWWILVIILAGLIAIMGRIVKMGAFA